MTYASTTPFDLLANQGDANAQFNLGLLYGDGKSLPQDYAKARYWHGRAAYQGHAPAQYSIALMHHKGLGMPQDNAQSAHWYRMAAEQGHQGAQFNLATLYDEGLGVSRDPVMAYVWFFLAGAKGQTVHPVPPRSTGPIASRLSYSTAKGGQAAKGNCDRIALQLTTAEREHAEQLADRYYDKYVLPFR